MTFLRALFRLIGLTLCQCLFLFLALLLSVFIPKSKQVRWRLSAYWGRLWARFCCSILNIRIKQEGELPQKRPILIISNHIGLSDILVVGSLLPCFFVAKLDVKSWPLIGWMAGIGGAVYVDRERRQGAGGLVEAIGERMDRGISVAMFPEGGAKAGDSIEPFKTSAFESAIRTGCAVLPVVLTYPDSGQPSVACWNDITFPQHLWRLLNHPRLEVTATVLTPVTGITNRRELSQTARTAMENVFNRAQ